MCPGWVRTEGGAGAPRSVPVVALSRLEVVEKGAAGIVWAATLAAGGPTGGFFRDGRPVAW